MARELPERYPTLTARNSLSRRFALPDASYSQDWEWVVADSSRFIEFLIAYQTGDLDADERFSLMEILIQCLEDMALPSLETSPQWRSIADLLIAHTELHASSVRYWSCLEIPELDDCFLVSGPMRDLWDMIQRLDEHGD